jgi:UDP-glucose 4-epimerase
MVLVTGGAGYVGSHVVAGLADLGYDVAVVDNLSKGHKAALRGAKLYLGDLKDAEFLDKVFCENKIDAVMHFAAYSLVGESMTKPLEYFNNNFYSTQCLVSKMKEYQIKNIVFSSSAAVYGEPDNVPIDEGEPTNPTNPYGETKLAIEKLLKWCDVAYDIKYASLRYFNVAGARFSYNLGEDHYPETHLIPLVLQTALGKRDKIKIFGTDYPTRDGTCIRDYIDVCDLADAHILAMEYLKSGGQSQIFNLGTEQGFSVKEVVEVSKKVTGINFLVEVDQRRAGDPAILVASSKKAKDILGWNPKNCDLEKIITSAWQWHKNNIDGYKD